MFDWKIIWFESSLEEHNENTSPLPTVNTVPALTGLKKILPDAKAGEPYSISASDLIAGFSDGDGDILYVDPYSIQTS